MELQMLSSRLTLSVLCHLFIYESSFILLAQLPKTLQLSGSPLCDPCHTDSSSESFWLSFRLYSESNPFLPPTSSLFWFEQSYNIFYIKIKLYIAYKRSICIEYMIIYMMYYILFWFKYINIYYTIMYHIYSIILYIIYNLCSNLYKLIFYKNGIMACILFHCVFSLSFLFFKFLLFLLPHICSFCPSSNRADSWTCIVSCLVSLAELWGRDSSPCLESGDPDRVWRPAMDSPVGQLGE